MNYAGLPIFTEVDSEEGVKGSRDPLGIQMVWTTYGRNVVKNLSTITNSPESFATLILGIRIIAQLVSVHKIDRNDFINKFLLFEQLCGYSRCLYNIDKEIDRNGDRGVRGVTRVMNNLRQDSFDISLASQILSDQKVYGIWGLYISSSEASGLINKDRSDLNDELLNIESSIKTLVDRYLQKDNELVEKIKKILTNKRTPINLQKNQDRQFLQSTARWIKDFIKETKELIFQNKLLFGSPLQQELWQKINEISIETQTPYSAAVTPIEIQHVIQKLPPDSELRLHLSRMLEAEKLLRLVNQIFYTFLTGLANKRSEKEINEIIKIGIKENIKTYLPIQNKAIEEVFRASDPVIYKEYWQPLSEFFNREDDNIEHLITILMGLNDRVMQARKSGGWVNTINNEKVLMVPLEPEEEIQSYISSGPMRYDFFIGSIKNIGFSLANL